jgi:hypothetical protein
MPISLSTEQFPDGRKFLRSISTGVVTGEDAHAMMTRLAPGGEFDGLSLLAVMEGKVDMQPEARKIFSSLNAATGGQAKKLKVAVVTSSAPLRVTMSFVMRIAGQANDTKFFGTEDEARNWLVTA